MSEEQPGPRYTGISKHVAEREGYALWLPSDWHRFKMRKGHRGAIFSPRPDDYTTSFSAEKARLPYKVKKEDLATLREGFAAGLSSLPGAQIEWQEETQSEGVLALDARFTFVENGERRKRWVRVIYAGNAQLTLIAQGRTPEDFEYWMPVFYNTMMTLEL